jgi:hypothetical protein
MIADRLHTGPVGPADVLVFGLWDTGAPCFRILYAGATVQESIISQTIVTDGQWHHLTFVLHPTSVAIYVDGVLSAPGTAALAVVSGTTQYGVELGANTRWTSQWMSGALDDVAFYPRALTADEITAHYAPPRPPAPRCVDAGPSTPR